jgi:23S rRNA pseudouridine1911/1915/1917 synthase
MAAGTDTADRTGADGSDADPDDGPDPDGAAGDGGELRGADVGPGQHGERLDRALAALAPEFSRSHVQALIRDGHARVDGRATTTPSARVRAGQVLELRLVPPAESRAFVPEEMPLAVLHEDASLVVLDKPAGLVVHPAAGHWSGTLLNGILARWPGNARLPRAGIVHRLDKDTSGLLVVAKSLEAQTGLVRALAARTVSRRYAALAHGSVPAAALAIDAPIGRDAVQRTRMAVVPEGAAGGKAARTHVERVAVAALEGGTVSAVVCALETGRTHQIRVHLASRGWPLVGDRTYGGWPALGLARQALHAARLGFRHPVTGAAVDVRAPLPADLAAAWAAVAGAPPAV